MNSIIDDHTYQQINKKLNDKIDGDISHSGENLFKTGIEVGESPTNYTENGPIITRAEYIKEAREACLRQLSSMEIDHKYLYHPVSEIDTSLDNHKSLDRPSFFNAKSLFSKENKVTGLDESSLNLFFIKAVIALVIFFSIFMIDKTKLKIGQFTHQDIKEYIVHIDRLDELEDMILFLLK